MRIRSHLAAYCAAAALLGLLAMPALADQFQCKSADGKTVMQDTPCRTYSSWDSRNNAHSQEDAAAAAARATAEQEKARRKADAEAEGDRRLAAEKDHDAADKKAAQAEYQRQHPPPTTVWISPQEQARMVSSQQVVDCTDLSLALKAQGDGLMKRTAIVEDARQRGVCVKR